MSGDNEISVSSGRHVFLTDFRHYQLLQFTRSYELFWNIMKNLPKKVFWVFLIRSDCSHAAPLTILRSSLPCINTGVLIELNFSIYVYAASTYPRLNQFKKIQATTMKMFDVKRLHKRGSYSGTSLTIKRFFLGLIFFERFSFVGWHCG